LYGAANPVLTGTLAGVQNGENISASYSTVATVTSPVGSYDIVPSLNDLNGKLGNYTVTVNNGIMNIGPATLTVTANDASRPFGAPNPVFTASYSGFVAGENASVLSGQPAFNTAADLTSPVGSPYPIIVSPGTLSAANYQFVFVPGVLTITAGITQPQTIVAITRLSDGSIQLNCAGDAGQTYLVQAAPDLVSHSWTTLATITTDVNGFRTWVDSSATNYVMRFYRTALP
jgi:hypothetical protein